MDVKQKLKLAQIKKHKKSLSDKKNISLNEMIGSKKCQQIVSECRDFRDRVYTPLMNEWGQVLALIKQLVINPHFRKLQLPTLVSLRFTRFRNRYIFW